MSIIGEAFIAVRPDTRGFEGRITGDVTEASRRAAVKGAAILAAGFAARSFARFIGDSIESFREAESVAAETESRLESLGDATVVTADQMAGLAAEVQDYSGIADETVQRSENLLLTFRSLTTEVAATHDVFERTVELSADVAFAMGGSGEGMAGAALRLGRAMDDPARGMTLLRRTGVQFSEQMQKQIKELTTQGDLVGAQNILLEELEGRFGGVAEAMGETSAGKAARLAANFDDVKESLGELVSQGLNPALEGLNAYAELANEALSFDERVQDNIDASVNQLKGQIDAFIGGTLEGERFFEMIAAGADGLRHSEGVTNVVAGAYQRLVEQIRAAAEEGPAVLGRLLRTGDFEAIGEEGGVAEAALQGLLDVLIEAPDATDAETEAIQALADSLQTAATAASALAEDLALATGVANVKDALVEARRGAGELRQAQAEVNQLAREGKKDTDEYREAVQELRDAERGRVDDVTSLKEAGIAFVEVLVDQGVGIETAIREYRNLAREAGVPKESIDEAVRSVRRFIDGLDLLPDNPFAGVNASVGALKETLLDIPGLLDDIDTALDRTALEANLGGITTGGGGGGGGKGGGGGSDGPTLGPPTPRTDSSITVNLDGRTIQHEQRREKILLGGG